jgi:hypothetical protein
MDVFSVAQMVSEVYTREQGSYREERANNGIGVRQKVK